MSAESCLRFFCNNSGHVVICFRDGKEAVNFAYAKAARDGSILFSPSLDLNSEDEDEEDEWQAGPALDRLRSYAISGAGDHHVSNMRKPGLPQLLELEHELDLRIRDAVTRAASIRLRLAVRYSLMVSGLDGAKKAFDQAMIESVMET